jgi:hypothetical protein
MRSTEYSKRVVTRWLLKNTEVLAFRRDPESRVYNDNNNNNSFVRAKNALTESN